MYNLFRQHIVHYPALQRLKGLGICTVAFNGTCNAHCYSGENIVQTTTPSLRVAILFDALGHYTTNVYLISSPRYQICCLCKAIKLMGVLGHTECDCTAIPNACTC